MTITDTPITTLYTLVKLHRSASGDHPLDTILDLLELALADDEGGDGRADAYWPRLHRSGPAAGLPLGDVDAVIKASLDALEHAGVIATDALVVAVGAGKHHDKSAPRVEITVEWDT